MSEILKLKLVIVGDRHVGKSSLILKSFDDKFNKHHNVAQGPVHVVELEKIFNNTRVQLRIVEIGLATFGGGRGSVISAYKGADGVVICFNLDNGISLQGAPYWIHELNQYIPYSMKFLVGTKCDRATPMELETNEETIREIGEDNNMNVFITSAWDGVQVEEAFNAIIDSMIKEHFPMLEKIEMPSEKRKWYKFW